MKKLLILSLLLIAPWSAHAVLILGDDADSANDISRFTGMGVGSISFGSVASLNINSPNVGTFDFATPGDSVVLNFVDSISPLVIEVNPLDSLFDADVEVLTGAGDDTFLLNAITGMGSYLINGGSDNDLLDLTELAGTLTASGTEIFQDGLSILTYSNIEEIKGLTLGSEPPNNSSTESPTTPDSQSPSVSVPEPSVIALFTAGLLGLGFARRRIDS